MTPKAVLRTLSTVWSTLEPLQLPMAVLGGLALSVWKRVRTTQDVDLLVGIDESDSDTLLATMQDAGFRPKRQPPIAQLGQMQILQMLYEPPGIFVELQVDILLADTEYHGQALQRRVSLHLPDVEQELFVLSCEDLILHKLLAGRVIDRIDVAALLRANRSGLDFKYMDQWVKSLSVAQDYADIWSEAFPDEALPE